MTSPRKKSRPAKAKPAAPDSANLDLDPDAWPKFEKLIKSAAKMGHKPHTVENPSPKSPKRRTSAKG